MSHMLSDCSSPDDNVKFIPCGIHNNFQKFFFFFFKLEDGTVFLECISFGVEEAEQHPLANGLSRPSSIQKLLGSLARGYRTLLSLQTPLFPIHLSSCVTSHYVVSARLT
eukprot:Blabericola_migrator_1__9782@NODE_5369_length_791_cov_3_251381_g3453_i0_p1_GENE_NODE_5369_length_791_cov_3_251381_g3453_i0NODE_5369_length_791_cov_3_251381_g3453_i0_p1_ORF_typecomplete_len110_score12_84_NODE_5369_length_791_cov_3_251381_g3453_i099428